jgi:hypothetical protein
MSDDYKVAGRSNAEVRALAKKLRAYYGLSNNEFVDVLACFERRSIWTVRGERPLALELKSDVEMDGKDGKTTYEAGTVIVRAKRSVRHDAFLGSGRDRNTFAHELGHGVMHAVTYGAIALARRTLEIKTPTWIKPFESAEHQTKVFAPAFLINDQIAARLSSAEEISVTFGISLESAEIYFAELIETRDRQTIAERISRGAREFHELVQPSSQTMRYMKDLCSVCQHATVFPVGAKFMCATCDTVYDRFQDGDSGDL